MKPELRFQEEPDDMTLSLRLQYPISNIHPKLQDARCKMQDVSRRVDFLGEESCPPPLGIATDQRFVGSGTWESGGRTRHSWWH